jgi:hypothetical protein
MKKFTGAPEIGIPAASATRKMTVAVVGCPEPVTPIVLGVAETNVMEPAAAVVVPPVVVPPLVPPVVPPVVPPPVVPPPAVPGPNPPEFVPVVSELQPAIASVAANKKAAMTDLSWFFMIPPALAHYTAIGQTITS